MSDDRTSVALLLHPQLAAFLKSQSEKTGRSIETEITQLIGEAMEASAIPCAPTTTPFVCSEAMTAQRAQCQVCDETVRHNAKLWAQRHVQLTGHSVQVSLHIEMRDEGWLDRVPVERRGEILDLVKNPDKARSLADSLLRDLKDEKPN